MDKKFKQTPLWIAFLVAIPLFYLSYNMFGGFEDDWLYAHKLVGWVLWLVNATVFVVIMYHFWQNTGHSKE